jgi:hypothetical protein
MKLAEALLLRADLLKKLSSLRERIGRNAVVQEGEKPHENPAALMDEARVASREFEDLVCRIHRANIRSILPDGRSLTEALAHRATRIVEHALLQHAIESSQKEPDRYGVREIKWVSVVKASQLQKECDSLASEIRNLNATIQQANWEVEID